jgi:hypothetical protein
MKAMPRAMTLAITFSLAAWAQDSAASPSANSQEKQDANAQAAKPAEPQGHTTITGCLSGPDASGKYTLRSMEHRTGVEVFGSDDLKKDSGEKVKLTGSWKPGDTPAVKGKESRRFQVGEVEVMSEKCVPPSEQTPLSKTKQQKQKQKSGSSAGDGTTPK